MRGGPGVALEDSLDPRLLHVTPSAWRGGGGRAPETGEEGGGGVGMMRGAPEAWKGRAEGCREKAVGVSDDSSSAPPGQGGAGGWYDGLRDAQSSIAPPVATFLRPSGANRAEEGHGPEA
jgi:hypothetical protein